MFKASCQRWLVWVLALGCFLALSTATLRGQGTSGTFTGTVTDASGAVVPRATVTIINQATGVKYNVTTNSSGVYTVPAVPPGQYTIRATKQGFQTYVTRDVSLSVDYTQRVDITLRVGAQTQEITVQSAAPLVNTETGRLSDVVSGSQIQNMPLNGRNIYDLMQLVPGAVNSGQVDFESNANGAQTNINGTRSNFNGFLLDGMSAKGLSGGTVTTPPPDFISEYRIQTNNFSAQYSNSAGSITDVATKSGTNQWHGDAFEFVRNDKLDARNFFDGSTKGELRMNEFGGTIGGPIKKDKMFIFGGVEFERFRKGAAGEYFLETPAWQQAVQSAIPTSAAALLYKNFPGPASSSNLVSTSTVAETVAGNMANEIGGPVGSCYQTDSNGNCLSTAQLGDAYEGYMDPCFLSSFVGVGSPSLSNGTVPWYNPQTFANNMASILGVTSPESADIAANIASGCPGMGFTAPGAQSATIAPNAAMEGTLDTTNLTESAPPFYNGSKWITRFDYQADTNRLSAKFYYDQNKDPNPTPFTGIRGFENPLAVVDGNATLSWVHTFSPTLLNEAEAGWTRDRISDIPLKSQFGVPYIGFDTGEPAFGSYNGYPQIFTEEIFDFKDMVTWVHNKHSIKMGASFKKNYENSEFNVGRPSVYFFDPFYFAGDLPYFIDGGVNPELTAFGGTGSAHLDTNIRAWRNWELGMFIQDDWKVTPHLTLNLGLRWDYYSPHTEKYNKATNLIEPPGTSQNARLLAINCAAFAGSQCVAPAGDNNTPTGGFTGVSSLYPSRYNNWGPRIGFAWDPRGNGKSSIRGGFAIQYEASFYNALSNSRWNLPYYSFNIACPICGYYAYPAYGPTDASGNPIGGAWDPTGTAPSYTGAQTGSIGNGPAGLGFQGNLIDWLPQNPNLAYLTGITSPNYRFPYVMNYFVSFQQELSPSTVFTISGVSTLSRHLFWAEDPNRVVGGDQRAVVNDPCTGATLGTSVDSPTSVINPCFGYMRTWETSVNSSYFGLQMQLDRKFSRGLAFTSAYTWGHSLDYRSTWHSLSSGGSATDANARGEAGYSSDPNRVYLEKGNSLFDVTHRWVTSLQWNLPWYKDMNGVSGKILGGWSFNTVFQLQSGFPFTVAAQTDYNGDGLRSDRPNTPSFGNSMSFSPYDFMHGSAANGTSKMSTIASAFPAPTCTGPGSITCDGNLGRNTFRGPGINEFDMSGFKKIPLGSNEARYLQFRVEAFNIFNHTNLNPPVANLSSGQFGYSTQALDPRQIQFALKLFF